MTNIMTNKRITFDERIQEVLNPLLNMEKEYEKEAFGDTCVICGFPFGKKEREKEINKTLSAIKTIIKESLPKKEEKEYYDTYRDGMVSGHNMLLDEIHRRFL